MPTCYAYCRALPRGLDPQGMSMAAHRGAMFARYNDLAKEHGPGILTWGGCLVDGIDSLNHAMFSRPCGFALSMLAKAGDTILVPSLERAFSSLDDMISSCQWADGNDVFLSPAFGSGTKRARVTMTDIGRAVAAFKTWDQSSLARRMQKKVAARTKDYHYGFKDHGGRWSFDPEARRLGKLMTEALARGWTPAQVAARLRQRGLANMVDGVEMTALEMNAKRDEAFTQAWDKAASFRRSDPSSEEP